MMKLVNPSVRKPLLVSYRKVKDTTLAMGCPAVQRYRICEAECCIERYAGKRTPAESKSGHQWRTGDLFVLDVPPQLQAVTGRSVNLLSYA